MADKKTAGLQANVHPVNGGGYDRFSEPLRKFWSRRRESTSVNGVCQALTTTSSILDGEGGTKEHNSRIWLWRMAARRVDGGFERCRGARRAARGDGTRHDMGAIRATRRGYARGGRATRREDGAVSVDGCGSCGEGVPKWESGGRTCANLVNSGRDFDPMKICTDLMVGLGPIREKRAASFAQRVGGRARKGGGSHLLY